MSQVINLSVDILRVHPQNIDFFDDIEGEQYERFKKSIEEDGVITPIIVSPDMTIISGHQRYKASKDLNLKLVPTIIEEHLIDEDEKLKKLLASNFGRLKNNPVKQGRVYEEYERLAGVRQGSANLDGKFFRERTQEDIAKELGVDARTLRNLKKLNQLSPELQQLIEDGQVTYTTALNVWGKLSNKEQAEFIKTMGKEQISNLTRKETESIMQEHELIKRENEKLRNRKPETIEKIPDDYYQLISRERQLQDQLAELERKTKNQLDKTEYDKLRKELTSKTEEIFDLKKQLEQAVVIDSKEVHLTKLKDTAITFSNRVHSFINSVGGLGWMIDYLDEIPKYEKEEYVKAVELLDKWVTTIKSNL